MNEMFKFPDGTEAVSYDMDGVLTDTVASDVKLGRVAVICALKKTGIGEEEAIECVERVLNPGLIGPWIHIDIPDFWDLILKEFKTQTGFDLLEQKGQIIETYNQARTSEKLPLLPGAQDAWESSPGVLSVVSTNFETDIRLILKNSGLYVPEGLIVVGKNTLDAQGQLVGKKPGSAPWLHAAQLAGNPKLSVALEDSTGNLTGLDNGTRELGLRDRWHLVGVGTGSASYEEMLGLKTAGIIDSAYPNLLMKCSL